MALVRLIELWSEEKVWGLSTFILHLPDQTGTATSSPIESTSSQTKRALVKKGEMKNESKNAAEFDF